MRDELGHSVTWLLALALVGSAITVVGIAMNPPTAADPYTEFYVLGPDGEAEEYPTTLAAGESETVIVGIGNHEHRQVTYRVVVTWDGTETNRISVTVPDGETRERSLALTAPGAPGRYEVHLLLYRNGSTEEPYRSLRLLVTVTEGSAAAVSPAVDGMDRWQ